MSGATSGIHAANSLASVLAASASLQAQQSTLQEQSTTGLISQNYAGVGVQASQILDLSATSAQSNTYTQVITAGQGQASAMQDALGQIGTLTSAMATQALQLTDSTADLSVSSVAQQAQQELQQLSSLLNTQYAGNYVFAGADTSNPPVTDPGSITSSGLYTQIGTAMSGLGATPVASIIASTVSSAASTAAGTSIFSTYLTTPAPNTPSGTPGGLGAAGRQIAIGEGQTVSLDYPANQNTNAVSDPSINGTGSAMNDILGGLAILAHATTSMSTTADFATVMQHVATTLASANQTITQEASALGNVQDTLTTASTSQSSLQTLLKGQISDLTNVDMASTISNMTAVNNQLQTSYQVLAMAKSLNLASFL